MTDARYMEIEKSMIVKLTQEELDLKWHFCLEWDGMLVGPGMDAQDSCLCFK